MFELYEKVRIKSNGVIGEIVDISNDGIYTVENTVEGYVEGGGNGRWAIFSCLASEIEPVQP